MLFTTVMFQSLILVLAAIFFRLYIWSPCLDQGAYV